MQLLGKAARTLSRRGFFGVLAGAALARGCFADTGTRLEWRKDAASKFSSERRYRVDAQVLVFGMTVLHRQNVGGGSASWREFENGGTSRLLEFNGFSNPDRAAGLSRVGFIRELSTTSGQQTPESIYFGLMTASPEESAGDARRSLHSDSKELAYTAVEGRIAAGSSRTTTAHFTAPAAISGQSHKELEERARRALAGAAAVSQARSPQGASHSFLQELGGLLIRPDGCEGRYVYSGRPYRMSLHRAVDGAATSHFRKRRLLGERAEAIRVAGKVRREEDGKETDFHLWIASDAQRPLPLRIEYQAKPYLRLTLEATGD